MKLGELLGDIEYDVVNESERYRELEIREVTSDSRAVRPGDLFVALPGQNLDGHNFLESAKAAGAVASVVEKSFETAQFSGLQIRVASSNRALGQIAANRYGRPADALHLIGITGTNGKTTTNFLIEAILQASGQKTGLFGTVLYRFGDKVLPAPNTTPLALELHRDLALMKSDGVSHVTMECSSHALALDRLTGIKYDVVAFTNLTQDHLDFHHTMDEYRVTKQRLFLDHLRHSGTAVVLVDSAEGERFANLRKPQTLRVSAVLGNANNAAIFPIAWSQDVFHTKAIFSTPTGAIEITSSLVGGYNRENLAVAIGVGIALGVDKEAIARGLAKLSGVPGRLERVTTKEEQAAVFVDYAHTPDALERVLQTLRELTSGRLITVFGCGGDRDNSKRPLMGSAAAAASDLCIVTSDNPRTEDPAKIIAMIEAGVREQGVRQINAPADWDGTKRYMIVPDRRQAIESAIKSAHAQDTVLIAGKGHEDYQIIGTTKFPFDDRVVARAIVESVFAESKP